MTLLLDLRDDQARKTTRHGGDCNFGLACDGRHERWMDSVKSVGDTSNVFRFFRVQATLTLDERGKAVKGRRKGRPFGGGALFQPLLPRNSLICVGFGWLTGSTNRLG